MGRPLARRWPALLLLLLTIPLLNGSGIVVSAAEPTAPPAKAAARKIVFLGDSLTAGYGLEEDQAYPALIQARMPSWTVANAGVSGDTSAGALRRVPWVLKAKPDVVFIAIGANDGLRGQPVDQLEANLRRIIAQVRAAGATAVLAGMRMPVNYGEDYRTAFAAVYPRVAEETRTPLMPFILESVAMKPELNQTDGIHPNAAGQKLVAAAVLAFLASLDQPAAAPAK